MGLKTIVKTPSTLIEILQELYPQSPRTRIKKLLQHNNVICNGKVVTQHSFKLNANDVVEIKASSDTPRTEAPPYRILYEDNDVIVIDKPAGLSTSDTDNNPNVYSTLSHYVKAQSKGITKAFLVHRIDRDVSGALLFAKSKEAMDTLQANWEKTEKLYYALVEGKPEEPEGTIESWLVEDKNFKVHSTQRESEHAKFSVTHFRTLKQFDKHTLLEIDLETGRKNQIRVHLSDIGCPIVGDIKYGATKGFGNRVRLHSFSITFQHPITKEEYRVESALPKGFLFLDNK